MRLLLFLWLTFSVFSLLASQITEITVETKKHSVEKKEVSWTPEELLLMKNASDNLAKSMPFPGIQVGEKAPNFTLKNAQGKKVTLESALTKGPVVLVFYRGAWCPYCNLHLRSLKENLHLIEQHNAQLITITPQLPDKSEEQFKKEGYPFEVLSDLDYKVLKDYRLYYELPEYLVKLYKKHGLDIASFNGEGRTALPVPGTFIIDTQGIVRAMQAQTDYKIRMKSDDVVKALSDI